MGGDRGERRMVTIDEEYLTFIHDALSENVGKLKEILGESGAQMIYSVSADRLVRTTGSAKPGEHPLDKMVDRIETWGMRVKRASKGDLESLEIDCPYAAAVHPNLKSPNPKCPLGEYVLGAARMEDPRALLQVNDLGSQGVTFVVKKGKK